jgi:hypothetical protein
LEIGSTAASQPKDYASPVQRIAGCLPCRADQRFGRFGLLFWGGVKKSLTFLLWSDAGNGGHCGLEERNGRHAASRFNFPCVAPPFRRKAGRPVPARRRTGFGSGNALSYPWAAAARLLGVSVRTMRNKIGEHSAEGVCAPRHERHDEILAQPTVLLCRRPNRKSP